MGDGGESGALPEFGGTRGQEVLIPPNLALALTLSLAWMWCRVGSE